jgi:hypothetical protein
MPSLDKGKKGPLPFEELAIHAAQDLLASYVKIKSSKTRAALVALAEAMVDKI